VRHVGRTVICLKAYGRFDALGDKHMQTQLDTSNEQSKRAILNMSLTGIRSSAVASNASRSSAPSPIRPKFDSNLLRAYMKKLLSSTLASASWPELKDKDKVKQWCKEIGERVKERAVGRLY
jgi:hypothetical protein